MKYVTLIKLKDKKNNYYVFWTGPSLSSTQGPLHKGPIQRNSSSASDPLQFVTAPTASNASQRPPDPNIDEASLVTTVLHHSPTAPLWCLQKPSFTTMQGTQFLPLDTSHSLLSY